MVQKIGSIPEFTTDEAQPQEIQAGTEQSVNPEVVETTEEVKEPPAEAPAAIEPTVDLSEVQKKVQGLETEKEKLLEEIKMLRGTRRELKQDQIDRVNKEIDELKDVSPDDVSVIERVLRSKGYVKQDEVQKMYYESVKRDELDKFLDKYPEYKPENDTNDINWSSLQRELGDYRMPSDPKEIGRLLEKAHKHISSSKQTGNLEVKRQQVAVASHGSGGVQRTSSKQRGTELSQEQKQRLLDGGWTEEDIKRIESR